MEKDTIRQIVDYLRSISQDMPSGTELFDVEKKLDKLIEIQSNQLDISARILEKLDNIYQEIPSGETSLDGLESKMDRLIDKAKTSNDHLKDIANFSRNNQ